MRTNGKGHQPKRVDLAALEHDDSAMKSSLAGNLILSAGNPRSLSNGGSTLQGGFKRARHFGTAGNSLQGNNGQEPGGQRTLLPAAMQKSTPTPKHHNPGNDYGMNSMPVQAKKQVKSMEIEKNGDQENSLVANNSVGLSDARNPLKALQRLRQDPDSTEFVYLRPYRVDETMPINPYHLEIVSHADIDEANFFTLSSFGVTHFINGKPEFSELEQWKREHYLFNAIVKIPVFRQYRTWKTYKVWRDSVRYGKMRKCSKVLQKDLFCLNPSFQDALLQIRGMCMDLKKIKLLNFEPGILYTLENFFHSQQAQRSNIIGQLSDFWVAVIDVARGACVETLESLEEGLFGKSDVMESADGKDGGQQSTQADSFRYTVMASKRVVQQRLFYFLRLADYIIFSTLHEMVVESVTELLDSLYTASREADAEKKRQDEIELALKNGTAPEPEQSDKDDKTKKKKPVKEEKPKRKTIFVTEVMLVLGDLTFVPAAADFENELESIVGGFVDTVTGNENIRLLNHEDLEQYTELYDSESDANEAATVSDIITNDEHYMSLVLGLKDAINDAFSTCNEYLQTFEPYRDMVIENEQLDAADMWENAEKGELVLDDFAKQLDTYSRQAANIKDIYDVKDCGIIEVNAQRLKEMIAPSPAACLEKLEVLLPQLAIIKQKKLLDEVGYANSKLNHKPTEVSEFVAILDYITEINEGKDQFETDFNELQVLLEKIQSHTASSPCHCRCC